MPTTLTDEQIRQTRDLLDEIRKQLTKLSGGDSAILFAMRRRVFARLMYDERGNPRARSKLKKQKFTEQKGRCAMCGEILPAKDSELDRIEQQAGYTAKNTRLVHQHCHRVEQAMRGFTVRAIQP